MEFAFDEDQELSRRNFRDLLGKSCTASEVRAAWSSDSGRVPALWRRLAEFGVLGLVAPEAQGGMGRSETDLILLLEEAGRAAIPEPLLETAAVAVPLLAALSDVPRVRELLERTVAGTAIVAVGLESSPYVSAAHVADALVLQRGDEAHLVPRDRVELRPEPSVDGARRLFTVSFRPDRDSCVARGEPAGRAFAEAFDRGALAAAAELVGLGARTVEMAIEYAKTRVQFGQPIGSFQAVKHQLVDAYLGLAFARPLVYRAAHSVAERDPERSLHVSAAKAFAADAAARAARVALQVHGAIGYSFEHDLHLWMKRIWALAVDFGDAAWHRRRVAGAVIGD